MIRNLKVLRGRVDASVGIGVSDLGNTVALNVTLDRSRADVTEALAPLEALFKDEANALVQQATTRGEIEAGVTKAVAKEREALAKARAKAEADAAKKVENHKDEVHKAMERLREDAANSKARGDAFQRQANQATEDLTSTRRQLNDLKAQNETLTKAVAKLSNPHTES